MARASDAILFERSTLGSLMLRNRIVFSPMTRVSAEANGTISEQTKEYYRIFAAGGYGAVITEGSYIGSVHSQTYLNQPGLAREQHVASWRLATDAIHAEGAAVIAQLQHSGPQSQGNLHSSELRAPSAIPARGEQLAMYRGSGPYAKPAALTLDEIAEVRQAFVDSALRARRAGFDGVEIHGANGYLLDAFLTDYLNQRTDQCGGSGTNRVRLLAEVALDIREALGGDFVVGIRISQGKVSDPHHKWAGGVEEACTVFGALANSGLDYIHTTEWKALDPAFSGQNPRSLATLAQEFAVSPAIIANGRIDTGAEAVTLLNSGQADFVAVAKAALSNRDWPARLLEGRELAPPFSSKQFGGLATIQDWEIDAPADVDASTPQSLLRTPQETNPLGPNHNSRGSVRCRRPLLSQFLGAKALKLLLK